MQILLNQRFWIPIFIFLALSACVRPQDRPDQLNFEPLVFDIPRAQKAELANGIRLYLKEDHELPLVQITAMMGAGSIGDPAEKTGLSSLLATALRTGGTGAHTPDALDSTLERLAADLCVAADTYATTFNLSLRAADLQTGLAILSDVLRRPSFEASRLELARKQAIETIRRQDDEPGSVAHRVLMQALYGEHPLGRTPTVESVSAVNRDDLVDFHRRYFHPNNLWLAVSGDFDRAELMRLLDEVFGDWQRSDFIPQEIPPVTAPSRPALLVAEKEIPQTTILIGDIGIDKSSPDLHVVRVMNFILGGGGFNSRLMREVRSNRGLTYSVYSYYQVGRRLPGPFIAGCETKSASTVGVIDLMKRVMEDIRETPVSPEEVRLARESLNNSFVFAFTDSHDVATQTLRLDFYGYPEGYLENYREQVGAVTAEDVLNAARKYLRPDQQTVVLVGDESVFDAASACLGLPSEKVPLGGSGE
jgi:zinc protease